MKNLYQDDLAYIHADGYGFHWEGASDAILGWLKENGIPNGLVVDLGCSGGQWLARLSKAGYETCGVDVSSSMIQLAKKASPSSKFVCGSFADIDIPECDVVTSLGEPLNYLNSGPAIRRTLKNVFAALRQGGVLIFDVRHPSPKPNAIKETHRTSKNWFCHSRAEELKGGELVRYITTFRQNANGSYRRDEEIHRLKLFPRTEMMKWLRKIGFLVKTTSSYGSYKLGPQQSVFICRKP
jgi:SAM-dependent methyltransferase